MHWRRQRQIRDGGFGPLSTMRRRQIINDKFPVFEDTEETPAEEFERVFGKPPHWKMKAETIKARLDEHYAK